MSIDFFNSPNFVKVSTIKPIPERIVKTRLSGSLNLAPTPLNNDFTVWVYDRESGELLGSAFVDRVTKNWEIFLPEASDKSLIAICREEGEPFDFNADVYDRLSLCAVPYVQEEIHESLDLNTQYPSFTNRTIIQNPDSILQNSEVTVPEEKGSIVKARLVQPNTEDRVEFLDSSNNVVSDTFYDKALLINEEIVSVERKITKPYPVQYPVDTFSDNSCAFSLGYKDGLFQDVSGNNIPVCIYTGQKDTAQEAKTEVGPFGETAFAYLNVEETTGKEGLEFLIKRNNSPVTVSFWVRISQSAFFSSSGVAQIGLINIPYYFNLEPTASMGVGRTAYARRMNPNTNAFVAFENLTFGSASFKYDDWHHFSFVFTNNQIQVYVDATLVKTYTGTPQPLEDFQVNIFNTWCYGAISALKVFRKQCTLANIQTLFNERPGNTFDISSIRSIQYNKIGDASLELSSSVSNPVLQVPFIEHHGDIVLGNNIQEQPLYKSTYILDDCIHFTVWRHLHFSNDVNKTATTSPGIDESNINVYMRFRPQGTGSYLLKMGNVQNGFAITVQPNALWVGFVNNSVSTNITVPISWNYANWYRIKVTKTRVTIYDDNDIEINSVNANINPGTSTNGQMSIGSNIPPWAVTRWYGFHGYISDCIIYRDGEMNSLPPGTPLFDGRFGSKRKGLAGLFFDVPQVSSPFSGINAVEYASGSSVNFGNILKNILRKTNSYTISFWLNPAADLSSSSSTVLTLTSGFGIWVRSQSSINKSISVPVWVGLNKSGYFAVHSCGVFVHKDKWTHLTFALDKLASTICLYADGILVSRAVLHNLSLFDAETTSVPTLSMYNTAFRVFDFRVYKEALTAHQIRNIAKGFGIKERNLPVPFISSDYSVSFVEDTNIFPMYKGQSIPRIIVKGEYSDPYNIVLALSQDNKTYKVFYNNTWRDIVSNDPTVHGNANSDWHYRTNANTWVPMNAPKDKVFTRAFQESQNRMNIQQVNNLTLANINAFYSPTVGKISFAIGQKSTTNNPCAVNDIFYKEDTRVWLSPIYNLEDFEKEITRARVRWRNPIKAGEQFTTLDVYVIKTGDTAWQKCTNFGDIPGFFAGMDKTGIQYQFKAEIKYCPDVDYFADYDPFGLDVLIE